MAIPSTYTHDISKVGDDKRQKRQDKEKNTNFSKPHFLNWRKESRERDFWFHYSLDIKT